MPVPKEIEKYFVKNCTPAQAESKLQALGKKNFLCRASEDAQFDFAVSFCGENGDIKHFSYKIGSSGEVKGHHYASVKSAPERYRANYEQDMNASKGAYFPNIGSLVSRYESNFPKSKKSSGSGVNNSQADSKIEQNSTGISVSNASAPTSIASTPPVSYPIVSNQRAKTNSSVSVNEQEEAEFIAGIAKLTGYCLEIEEDNITRVHTPTLTAWVKKQDLDPLNAKLKKLGCPTSVYYIKPRIVVHAYSLENLRKALAEQDQKEANADSKSETRTVSADVMASINLAGTMQSVAQVAKKKKNESSAIATVSVSNTSVVTSVFASPKHN